MSEVFERTDGIPLAEVADLFACRVDTMSKRLKSYPNIETYRSNRAVYVVPPAQWPVAWGQPKGRESSGSIQNEAETRSLQNVPEPSRPIPLDSGLGDLLRQLSERDQQIGKLSEQLKAAKRETTRAKQQVDALNDTLVEVRLRMAAAEAQNGAVSAGTV